MKNILAIAAIVIVSFLTGCGGDSSSSTPLQPPNSLPLVEAGSGQTVGSSGHVILLGTASDPDGSIATYAWLQTSGPAVTIVGSDSIEANFDAPEHSANLSFRLTVTDNSGATADDEVSITVDNSAPIVTLVTQVESQIAFTTILTAQAEDQDGTITDYVWQQISGDAIELISVDQASISFVPISMQSEAVIFQLTVTDNGAAETLVQTVVEIKPTLAANFLPSNEVHYDSQGNISRCISVQYNESAQVTQHLEYVDVGDDQVCFTEDDSQLDQNKSYIRYFETMTSGLQQHFDSITCASFEVDENYGEQTTLIENYDTCEAMNIIGVTVWTPYFNKFQQFTLGTLAFGGSNSTWPGNSDNPASTNNPVVFGLYENIYDETSNEFISYLESDNRGADNIWQTADDEITLRVYVLPFYDAQGNTDYLLRYNLGDDGVMNTGDETILAMSKNNYSTSGLLEFVVDYRNAGLDGNWLTIDDNEVALIRYQKFMPRFELIAQ
ncbi:MAG: cadherin-like domain-containing protein [Colwellia sp.]|nr:cadherin-like domain-containing protein [Colwellia sp.]